MESTTLTISHNDILAQVDKICSDPEFKSKVLLCRFLRFVVKETLAGSGDKLKGYTIGLEVLKKDMDFDPEQDSLVRIHASRLRRQLRLYYLESGKNDSVHIDIPKGNYQAKFIRLEAEPKIKKVESASKSFPLEPSIAVLPFKNLTSDVDKDYFAHGFSEEISVELTKYEDLNVIYCQERPNNEIFVDGGIYDQYSARFIIDGGVLIFGQKIKILVKLIDIVTGNQIWADGYVRDLSAENLIDIEDDIADSVAKTIGGEIGIIFKHLTNETNRVKPRKMDEFNAIFSFYYYESHQSYKAAQNTFNILNRTLSQVPQSGIIHAMLASMYGNTYSLDLPGSEGALEKMNSLIVKAVSLNPDHQLVRITHAYSCFLNNDKRAFFEKLDKLLTLNLNSPGRIGSLGFQAALFGDWKRGKILLDRAMNKNVGYPLFCHGASCLYHYRIEEYEQALNEAMKYDMPGLFWPHMLRAACLGQMNNAIDAKNHILNLKDLKPDFEKKAAYLIGIYVKEKELVKQIVNGLQKAGMDL